MPTAASIKGGHVRRVFLQNENFEKHCGLAVPLCHISTHDRSASKLVSFLEQKRKRLFLTRCNSLEHPHGWITIFCFWNCTWVTCFEIIPHLPEQKQHTVYLSWRLRFALHTDSKKEKQCRIPSWIVKFVWLSLLLLWPKPSIHPSVPAKQLRIRRKNIHSRSKRFIFVRGQKDGA